jgi:hypothetical protein
MTGFCAVTRTFKAVYFLYYFYYFHEIVQWLIYILNIIQNVQFIIQKDVKNIFLIKGDLYESSVTSNDTNISTQNSMLA